MRRYFILALLSVFALASCTMSPVYVHDGHFMREGQPQYFVGVNMWHATEIAESDPYRLRVGLDSMQVHSTKNIRIMVTDEAKGLNKLLRDMSVRGLYAVVCLNDGETCKFDETTEQHIREIVEEYKKSDSIFSWEICDAPQLPVAEDGICDTLAFIERIQEIAHLIKTIDPNHMVSVGSEGSHMFGDNKQYYKLLNDCSDIDYLTMHIWPNDWGWINLDNPAVTFGKVSSYLADHISVAEELNKPLVIENFGFSKKEGFMLEDAASLENRDRYFEAILGQVMSSIKHGGKLAGCNMRGANGPMNVPMEQYVIYPPSPGVSEIILACNHRQNSVVTIYVKEQETVLESNGTHRFNAYISSSGEVVGMLKLTLTTIEGNGDGCVVYSDSKLFRLRNSHEKIAYDLSKVPEGRYKGELSFGRQRETGRHDYQAIDPFFVTVHQRAKK